MRHKAVIEEGLQDASGDAHREAQPLHTQEEEALYHVPENLVNDSNASAWDRNDYNNGDDLQNNVHMAAPYATETGSFAGNRNQSNNGHHRMYP